MPRPNKYQKIIDVKHAQPSLSWTDAARKAGFEVGNFTASGSYTKDGKAIPKLKNKKARKRQKQNRLNDMKLDKELLDELTRQESLGNLKQEDYFADRARRLEEYKKALARYKETGVAVDDGHMTTRKNNSPNARAPELSRVNQAKQAGQPLSDIDMLDAMLPRSDVEDLYNYLAPSQLPDLNVDERARMLSGEISGQQALAIADNRHRSENFRVDALGLSPQQKAMAMRASRRLAPGPLSIIPGFAATGQQLQNTLADPSPQNIRNLAFDAGNSLADIAGLHPLTAGPSEVIQRGLDVGQMAANASDHLQSMKVKPPN